MEQAVNMFTGGLVLDQHPLTQSNDSLSDALNATIITMNGDEPILQNDMGNRRVDNAFLPAGYEPVGIKEYGGIIYVASYNPLTKRSQIGSFPSPERNMGMEYDDNGTFFEFDKFFDSNNYIVKDTNMYFLKNDGFLLELTKDTSLHAGDKFTVHSGYIWQQSSYITNFNSNPNLPQLLKNNYFTLSLGVLNSQNEFFDITPSLERYNANGDIINNLETEEEKFNTGYFIAPTFDSETSLGRNTLPVNTYAYKLTGPLYLKVQFNHIKTIRYNMEFSKQEVSQNDVRLNVFLTATATCDYSLKDIDFLDFLVFRNNQYQKQQHTGTAERSEIYDEAQKQYVTTISKQFVLQTSSFPSNEINYYIAVPVYAEGEQFYNYQSPIYIQDLSEKGTIDTNLVGTNSCELTEWRFMNIIENEEVTQTILNYKFDIYKDRNTVFNGLTITLQDQTSREVVPDIELISLLNENSELQNGRQEILIDWSDLSQKIEFRHLYKVTINYNKNGVSETLERFILGTELFNSCYSEGSEDFVPDYKIFMDGYTPDSQDESALITKYLDITNNIIIKDSPKMNITSQGSNTQGSPIALIGEANVTNNITKTLQYKIDVIQQDEYGIDKENLYPLMTLDVSTITNNKSTNVTASLDGTVESSGYYVFNPQTSSGVDDETFKSQRIALTQNLNDYTLQVFDTYELQRFTEPRVIGKAYVNVFSHNYINEVIDLMQYNQRFNGFTYGNGDWNRDQNYSIGQFYSFTESSSYIQDNIANANPDCGFRWDDHYQNIPQFEGHPISNGKNIAKIYDEDFIPAIQTMKCPFTFMLFDQDDSSSRSVHDSPINYFTNLQNITHNWDSGHGYREKLLNRTIDVNLFSSNKYCRVWWANDDSDPILLNNLSNYNDVGLFNSTYIREEPTLISQEDKVYNIYVNILAFIGKVKVDNVKKDLVIPLKNYSFNAQYPKADDYRFIEEGKINLSASITNSLQFAYPNRIVINHNTLVTPCIKFIVHNNTNGLQIIHTVDKILNFDNRYSQSIYELSQQLDLSSYSIDIETGNILSDKDTVNHLYVRNTGVNDKQLRDVPKNFVLQSSQETKYIFPITCTQKYRPGESIGNEYQFKNDSQVTNGTWAARCGGQLKLSSKRIPILKEEDLVITTPNFFSN